jgi:thiamine-phosphate pyrophosphorylase
LLVITDRKSTRKDLSKIINDCFKAGVKAIQLREKDLPSNRLLALANKLKKTTKSKLIINDRLDIALLSSSDGVHSPEKGIDAKYIKKYAKNLLAGRSVHSKEQAIRAERGGFDYLLFGPVFRTPTKIKYGAPQGLKKLKQICSAVNIPVFAVGGITPRRVKKCLTAGAYGVASISAVMKSANIRKTISEFKGVLEGL